MAHLWRGWCSLRPGLLLYGGTIGTNQLHAHHAVHLIVAAEPFTMADARGRRLTTLAAVVPPDTGHTLLAGARGALLAQLEPGGSAGRALLARSGAGPDAPTWGQPFTDAATPPFADPAEAAHALELVEHWTGRPGAAEAPAHPAVERAVAVIPALLRSGPVRLDTLAAAVHLSPSRLAHLFSAHVGIPLRPYVRWRRVQHAIALVAAGETLTDAAHSAGFTDGPHFTRVFRRTFGTAPSTLAAAVEWLP
ncbi:helix-turn-helix transcriptional regulator [Nonomuraea spiralis]|uniref:Helix-turn-helix transcriptional regulator n=1 Tax=Nonomuraea spiralis TaxID=46182 RepID=A0ABV5IVX3_9ACTN|nr:helix-turn-helix transcriptional regulator [Nonomuraea spiralis]GGS90821.1 putative transcriptional regulator, AraC family protein [Nonomuraea spiralis]